MKKAIKVINLLLMIGIITTIFSPFSNAFAYKAIGWHWYNELPFVKEKKENKKQQKPANNRQERSSTTAVAEMVRQEVHKFQSVKIRST